MIAVSPGNPGVLLCQESLIASDCLAGVAGSNPSCRLHALMYLLYTAGNSLQRDMPTLKLR